ncbi:hypothetical protein [Methanohalophilus halophilus]|uniref:Permease n=1 Tax=Methanohalophilus halophilus TaxID=2177 RepID=A0A1L3Q159_9EURY|nr:hypothetical protein [Methanohalophilus halophilus]APH38599.1 hypothetical protein BHR79_03255 [Methanohalophilus halophilus]RNI08403.1 hypothetical protein EFE40_07605 [Methanohalophilus halophilus]SDW16396.1 hypothetical protein SAMN04515625_0484 [Methanohalophilus halophilus]
MNHIGKSAKKTLNALNQSLPVVVGVIMAISLLKAAVPESLYSTIFTGNILIDPFIGSLIGSIAAGNPITSYIIGGELIKQGVSLFAVTAFLLSWVTVGIISLPAEMDILGKKFALTRNIICFIVSFFVAILTVITLGIVGEL